MASPLVELMQAPDSNALGLLMAEGVRFHSPVADYEGRADVAHLLLLIADVVRDIEPSREFDAEATKVTFISGLVEERPVQGVIEERYDDRGRLAEATLMLRPLATLRMAVAAMAAALEVKPLPSTTQER